MPSSVTPKETPPSKTALIVGFATIYLIWGSTYLGIRIAVETIPPFAMAAIRFILAGGLLYGFLRLRGEAAPTRRQWRDNALIGIFLLVGGNGLVSWAEQTVPSGIAALIVAIGPLFTVLIEWAWPGGQRPGTLVYPGLAAGIAGAAWLSAPWETPHEGSVAMSGVVALVFACFFWGFGSIFSKRTRHPAHALMASAMQMLCGGLALAFVASLRGEWVSLLAHGVSRESVLATAYLTVAGSLIAFSTFAWLMKHSSPALVSTYAYVNPVVAVILGWLVLSEPISPRVGVAGLLIVASVILITLGKTPKKPQNKAP